MVTLYMVTLCMVTLYMVTLCAAFDDGTIRVPRIAAHREYMVHDTWCVEQAPPPLHVEWRPEKESKEANPLGLDDVRQAFAAFGGVRNVVMAEERSANGRRGARGAAPSCT